MKGLLQKIASIAVLMVLSLGLSAQITAQFSPNNTSGCSPLVVIFTDQSTGNPTNWRWDFGNSNGSIQQNPSAIYLNPGTYTVRLIASGPGGIDTVVKTQLITVFRNPDAKFVANRTSGCIPAPISFTDISVPGDAPLTSWISDFGDGSTSTQQNPSHTYTTAGTYTVTLLARDANGCKHEFTRTSYITIMPKPTVAFTGTPTNGCNVPHTVNFNNTTTGGSGFTYAWSFGDGSTSTQQNPSHTYNAGGNFTVRLIATNSAGCSDTLTRTNYVSINNIVANFSVNRTNPCVGQNVTYTSNSPGAVWWRWTFGDGNTSTFENPVRSYSTPGLYTVTLIVRNSNGCYDTITRTNYIDVKPRPVTNFTATPTAGCEVPFTVQFNNTTVDGNTYFWEFGDGTTSTAQNPSHTYTSPGTYTVRLVATSVNGCTHSRTRTDYITVQLPTVAFTANVREGCIPLAVQFTDQSSANNGIIGWSWNFGDGSTSTLRNPSHTYTTVGRFDVTLTITTASGCTRTVTYPQYIRAGEQPTVEFTATPRQTCLFFPVSFTDLSTPADFWFWQFGDGGTSFDQNPVYQYGDTGLFTVTLIVGVNGCYDTLVKPDYIRIFPPRASFNTLYSCSDPYSVNFTNTSLGGHVWLWKFGTGDTAITRNASYTYPTRGDYTVTLIVWDTIGGCLDSSQALVQIREPIATFTANDTIGCVNLPVTFTNNATDAFSYQWDFGNGQTSTDPNPSVLYQTPGVYTVRLIVRDIHNCPDTFIRPNYITALGAFANFDADTLTGCTPLNVQYQDLSTSFMGNVVAWNWDLGAGQTSTQQNPSASYTVPGNYTISLTVTDDNGCSNTLSRVNFIVPTYPTPAFYSDDTLVCLGGPVQFTNTSVGTGMTYAWAFGDGTTSTATNPTHTFADTGRYTITLQVFDINGCDSTTVRNQYIHVVQPTAQFVTDTLGANCPPLLVNFANQSSADVTSWLYNFGNGSTSTLENPTHIYTTPGVYYPTLTITNSIGCTATYNLPDSIVVGGPTGSFIYNQITFCAPFEVEFYAQGTNPAVTHIWDFGDGSVSVDDDTTTHYYATPGTFNPQLILDDNMGCVISLPTISPIFAAIVNANFVSDVTYMCRPGVANFTDLSSGVPGIVAWHWDFGDGDTSNAQNPSHYYAATGSYNVTLIATNAVGCSDTLFRPGYIRVMDDPTALFTVNTQNACFPATINFTNQSTADTTISSILWVFDDGTTSTLQNPSRNYANPGTYNVQLMITTVMGCKDTFAMPITLSVPPAAAAGLDLAICIGQSETLSGTGGVTYQWSPATGLSATNIATPVASPTVTTNYVLLVTDANGCQDRDTVTVTVNPLPTPTASGGTICVSGSAQLNANGGVSYVWNNGGTLTNNAIANPMANPTVTTSYSVTVTDINGCVNTTTATINVNQLPTVTTSPNATICIGESSTLSATGGVTYLWSPAATLSNANIAGPVATPTVTTTYNVTVTDANGCINYGSTAITVNPLPVVATSPPAAICIGQSSQLAATGGVSYVWSNGASLSNAAIANPIASPTATTTYNVTVTDANGCINTGSTTITVNPLPTPTATGGTICINGSTQLNASGGVSYTWNNGATLSNDAIRNPQATPTATTTYIVTVTDANGCINTAQALVNVNPLPTVTTSPNATICIGESSTLSATGGVTYLWSPAATLSNANISGPVATPTITSTYNVTVTDANGCINYGSTTITVNPLPVVATSPPAAICIGQSSQLTATGGVSYAWSNGASLSNAAIANPIANPIATTTYNVTVTDANGCINTGSTTITVNPLPIVTIHPDTLLCLGERVQLFATGGAGYSWGPAAGLNCLNCPNPIATPTVNTTYTAVVTNIFGCVDSAQVRVNLNTVDARFSTSDTTACAPTTIQFNDLSVADSTIVAWGWIFGDGATSFAQNPSHNYTVAGVYTAQLQVTTSTGCIDTTSLVITINALPAVAAGPDRTICINDTATLLGTGGVVYQWSPAGSLSDATVASPQAFPTNTTTYGLTVTDANGCQGTSQVIVNVNPLPVVTTTPSQELCNGDVLQLNATGGVGYLWTPASGLSCTACPNPIANPFSPTNLVHTYTVQVTDTNGCINTGSTTITRLLLPGITINPDTTICFGNAVEISGGSMQPFTYLWQPSAGLACDTCSTTIATPDSTTTYTLTATGVNGCPRSEEVTITVNPLPIVVTSPDTTICHNQTVELTASGGVDYVWTPTQGITCNNNCNTVIAAPDSSITYTVLVTDANGCQSTAEIDVVVHQLEAIFTLSDSSACTPQHITLTDQSSGDNPIVSWLWNLDDGGLANTQNTTVTYSTPGQREIVLLIQDSYGCIDTAMQVVDMLPSPVAIGGPDTTICFGQVAQLQGFGGQIFVWSGDQSISDPNIADPTVKPTTTTDYFLRTEFFNGCTAFDTVKVTVNALPIPAINGDTVACFGDSLRFTATGGSDYVWTPTTYLTTSTLPNTTAYAAQDITYTVLVTDTNGCAAIDSIVLKVNPVPAITVSPNVDICLGESANLQVSGAIDYAWGPNQDISCLDCTNPTATPTESITYLVVGYNEFGCSTLDTVRVNVRPLPTVQTIADVTLCNSETLELTTTATGATGFNWTANGQPDANTQNPIVTPTASTTYIVEAYNQYGCNDFDTVNVKVIETILAAVSDGAVICDGQNVNLSIDILETGLSGYTITWLPESMFNNPNRLSQTFFPGESMTVQVAINSEGCAADTQSINIVVNSLPTVDLGPNRTVLMGEYVTLNANTTGNIAEYYWSPNDSLDCIDCDNVHFNAWGSNTYNVFVTDVNGCTAEDDISVKVLTTCEQDIFVPNSFSPNNDKSNDVLYVRSHSFEQIKVFRIFDRWGNLVFETSDIEQGWNGTYHNSMVDPGVFVYYLEGTCPNGGEVFLKGNVTVLR
jgi:gliding motility-associated-like protein